MKTKWDISVELDEDSKLKDLKDALLKSRDIKPAQYDTFLSPPHPHSLLAKDYEIDSNQLDQAVSRMKKAISKKEHILVYGDYDADGVSATAIMWEVLHNSGAKATPFVPDRFVDGYGINKKSLKTIFKKYSDIKLVVTVDNGIVAYDAIDFAKKSGVDVVITDHHKKGKNIADVVASVHTTKVSGAAIAYFVARSIDSDYDPLDLAAIGLIADQVPLVGPARAIVKHGVAALKRPHRVGLQALYKEAGIKDVTARTVGFSIAPRINAAGRMGSAMDALRLLCTNNFERADKLAGSLSAVNQERQKQVEMMTKKALQSIKPDSDDKIIVVSSKSFHEGVIGLIASKLVEKYNRPAIVLSIGDEIAKASARSVKGTDLVKLIRAHDEYIIEGGGHQLAAGFSMDPKRIAAFTKAIQAWEGSGNYNLDEKTIYIDALLPFTLIDWDTLRVIGMLDPVGAGNPEPLFVSKKVSTVDARHVGKDSKHLKLKLKQNGRMYTGIAFGMGSQLAKVTKAGQIDIAYALSENEWNGVRNIDLVIKDIKILKDIKTNA